jgi:hypothetical protein
VTLPAQANDAKLAGVGDRDVVLKVR